MPRRPELDFTEDTLFIREWIKGGAVPTLKLAQELVQWAKWAAEEDVVLTKQLQRDVFDESLASGWDPGQQNSFAEELAHLHEELSEAFQAWRANGDFRITYREDGKPEGVPIELADVVLGILYNCEREGVDLFEAVEIKRRFNATRDYVKEGRQLHG